MMIKLDVCHVGADKSKNEKVGVVCKDAQCQGWVSLICFVLFKLAYLLVNKTIGFVPEQFVVASHANIM